MIQSKRCSSLIDPSVAAENTYRVRFLPIGPEDPELGAPTQMAIFETT